MSASSRESGKMSLNTTSTEDSPNQASSIAGFSSGMEHKWAVLPSTRANGAIISFLPIIVVLAISIGFNNSRLGTAFYEWLNANYTPYQINAYWTYGITSFVHWTAGLIFMAFDLNPFLHAKVHKYKIQPEKQVTLADYKKIVFVVARNSVCCTLPMCMAVAYWTPLSTSFPLPSALETIATFAFCLACEEIGFYLVHRAFHSKLLYRRFHLLHHSYGAPVALAGTYASMTEQIVSNLAPIVHGFVILGKRAHWSSLVLFFSSLLFDSLTSHSNYNLPGLDESIGHDWHHYYKRENFGPTGVLDSLFGTDKNYKLWLKELERRDKAGKLGTAKVDL